MAVTVKSAREIELMTEAGIILAKTHEELEKIIRPGISTWEINKVLEWNYVLEFYWIAFYVLKIGEKALRL